MVGKQIRLERIMDRNTGNAVIVPMDHGVSVGPIYGITDMKRTIDKVCEGGANAIVIHKGIVPAGHRKSGKDIGLIVHLSGSTAFSVRPNAKSLVCSVEEAIRLGADGVSIHVNIGDDLEREMLRDFGRVSRDASYWGIPLLAMVYPRGGSFKGEYDPDAIAHAARLGSELGADIIKVSYSGDVESFRRVVECCHVPVVIAGGEKMGSDDEILSVVKGSIDAGGAGLSIGRNIFQHKKPIRMIRAMAALVHDGASIDDAREILARPLPENGEPL